MLWLSPQMDQTVNDIKTTKNSIIQYFEHQILYSLKFSQDEISAYYAVKISTTFFVKIYIMSSQLKLFSKSALFVIFIPYFEFSTKTLSQKIKSHSGPIQLHYICSNTFYKFNDTLLLIILVSNYKNNKICNINC